MRCGKIGGLRRSLRLEESRRGRPQTWTRTRGNSSCEVSVCRRGRRGGDTGGGGSQVERSNRLMWCTTSSSVATAPARRHAFRRPSITFLFYCKGFVPSLLKCTRVTRVLTSPCRGDYTRVVTPRGSDHELCRSGDLRPEHTAMP